ncbi:DUF397 domain-containing protein [Planomonospora parontospora]|uniref:DUF397 domain-containing protein n=1 Tax=Planomonospora parontospora TaxID=58119 RepID=UPI00166F87BE|nr:DUF397 domain-containing protein [Planomonospora parontospora]GGL54927.1 hypothetical protein GCM10014719_65290 [Planomonospora parontospora subsp. antibiotica]GII19292.1 hypothetical protein Ppa05_60180 [Planomonospora parontospora subsp. antibiotica]
MSTSPASPDKFPMWRKSRRSGGDGNCVEVAFAADGTVGVRDSKDRSGPHLEFTRSEWEAFTGGVKDGEFDQP